MSGSAAAAAAAQARLGSSSSVERDGLIYSASVMHLWVVARRTGCRMPLGSVDLR